MLESLIKSVVRLFGSHNERQIRALQKEADHIASLEPDLAKLTDAELQAKTDEFRARLAAGETEEDICHEAFAVVREASRRIPPPGSQEGSGTTMCR